MQLRYLIVVVALILVASRPAPAAPASDVLQTVQAFDEAINTGNEAAVNAKCESSASIIDEFAPYHWTGPHACADWFTAFSIQAKNLGITDGVVTLAKNPHVDVDGDRAYVIERAVYAWKQRGKPMAENAARLTVALHQRGGTWRITGWAWSKV